MAISIGAGDMVSRQVADIPKLTHKEAGIMAQVEYERLLAVLESLSGEDWQKPTYCKEWNVRDMVAHIAGAVAGSNSVSEFKRQNIDNPYGKEFDDPVDGTNKLQIEDRADMEPEEIVAEFREKGQRAVANRQKLPWPIRKIHLPMGSLGFASFEYLMDTIYSRDQWMHRYDICAATGKKMITTPAHDGRLVALVLRDIAKKLHSQFKKRTIILKLLGDVGSEYQFGQASTPDCTIEIDLFDFNLRASGRITLAEALSRTAVTGDQDFARWFLENCEVPY